MKKLVTHWGCAAVTVGAAVILTGASANAQVISNGPAGPVYSLPAEPVGELPPASPPPEPVVSNTPPVLVDVSTQEPYNPELKVVPGAALAEYGRHKVRFDANIGSDRPTRITTPGGRVLQCRPTLLSYYDASSGKSVLLAEVQSRVGGAIQPDRVIYEDAFDDLKADVLYTCTLSSLEQDIILRQRPPSPAEFGLDPATTTLEFWTEWFDSQPVRIEERNVILREAGVSGPQTYAADSSVDFGTMKLVMGSAFNLRGTVNRKSVSKVWQVIQSSEGDRTFLIESVDYIAIEENLKSLPLTASVGKPRGVFSGRDEVLMAVNSSPGSMSDGGKMLMARTESPAGEGVVLDFVIVASVPLPADAVSWWRAGGNAEDSIGSNDGTLYGNAGYTAGVVGQGFTFDGNGDYVQVASAADISPTGPFTMEGWINYDALTGSSGSCIFAKGVDAASAVDWALTVSINNTLRPHVKVGTSWEHFDCQTTLDSNTWYHVAMVYDGSSLLGYVNGVLDGSNSVSGTLQSTTNALKIGAYAPVNGSWTKAFWDGEIDELTFYDRALSETELSEIYEAGGAGKHDSNCVSPPDDILGWWPGDGNVYDLARTNFGTLKNGATYASARVSEGYSLDGVNDYVEIADAPGLSPTDAITLEAWVYTTGNQFSGQQIIGKDNGSSSRQYLMNIGFQGKFQAHVWEASGTLRIIVGTTVAQLNTWYHVAMTYDRTNLLLYVNGTQEASMAATGAIKVTTTPVRIGGAPYYFKGLIDEATVYDRALSSTEISALYAAGGAGKCKVDTDNDGLTDLQEDYLGTDPEDSDSDDDLLEDGDEVFAQGTDPNDSDTDDDGVNDGTEVLQGRNPKSPSLPGSVADTNNVIALTIYTPLN